MDLLTPDERQLIFNWYPKEVPTRDDKRVLKVVKFMPKHHIELLCKWVDPLPFRLIKPTEWTLEYGYDVIALRGGLHAYHLHTDNCNVHVYIDGRLTTDGNNANAILFYMMHGYSFPICWAGNKTPFELGIAIPDKQQIIDALNVLYNKDQAKVDLWLFDKRLFKIDLTDIQVFDRELTEIYNEIAALKR